MQDPLAPPLEESETPPRELTLEEAVTLAVLLQKNDQLIEAQEVYRRIIPPRCITQASWRINRDGATKGSRSSSAALR